MMIDTELVFSSAQALAVGTGTTYSTNSIDQDPSTPLSAPVNLDAYVAPFLFVRVATTFTSGGAGTLQVTLETDNDPAFGTTTIVMSSAVYALAALTAKAVLVKNRLPSALKRYLRVGYVVGTAAMTAGACDAMIVNDIDKLYS